MRLHGGEGKPKDFFEKASNIREKKVLQMKNEFGSPD